MSRVGPRSWSSFKDNLESVRLPDIQLSGVITPPVGVNVYAVSGMVKKIIILSGLRQVGKTTLSKQLVPSFVYLNYDSGADRRMILDEEWPRDTLLMPLIANRDLNHNLRSKPPGGRR